MSRAVVEGECPGGLLALVKVAEAGGWYTVVTRGEGQWKRSWSRTVVLRAWRGGRHCVVVYTVDEGGVGKVGAAYLWRREHEATAPPRAGGMPAEAVRWTSPTPTPDKVSVADLRKYLKSEVDLRQGNNDEVRATAWRSKRPRR